MVTSTLTERDPAQGRLLYVTFYVPEEICKLPPDEFPGEFFGEVIRDTAHRLIEEYEQRKQQESAGGRGEQSRRTETTSPATPSSPDAQPPAASQRSEGSEPTAQGD